MVGNVWEWTEDCAHGNYNGAPADGSAWMQGNRGNCNERHLRGGSYLNAARILGSAIRFWLTSGDRNFTTGFRVARTLSPTLTLAGSIRAAAQGCAAPPPCAPA